MCKLRVALVFLVVVLISIREAETWNDQEVFSLRIRVAPLDRIRLLARKLRIRLITDFARNRPSRNCPPNERYVECPATECEPKTCDDAGFPLECQEPKGRACPGPPGCICIDGYLRNCQGDCIPSQECPSCGGDANATSGCGTYCNNRCSNYNNPEPRYCEQCFKNACECRPGYVFDENTQFCVLPADCTPVCGDYEVYSQCANSVCRQYCDDLTRPDDCDCPDCCEVGCVCVDGYLRNATGACVPIDQCPEIPSCPENERYEICPDAICEPKTCDEAGFALCCLNLQEGDTCPGEPGCICEDGYLRGSDGVCVPLEECPSCGGDVNSTLGCGIDSSRLCSNYFNENAVSCNLPCYPNTCSCRPDYVYDSNTGRCVLPFDCTPVCPVNEIYLECPAILCIPQTCDEAGFPLCCPSLEEGKPCPGPPGCVCLPGLLRNSDGVCVPSQFCPSCGGDTNATLGCGIDCSRLCSNYESDVSVCCNQPCSPNACTCREGYAFDTNTGLCVLPMDCTPTCPQYERYEECPVAMCTPQYCDEVGYPVCCKPRGPGESCSGEPGCVCIDGYLRDSTGVCIPSADCPSCGGDANSTMGLGIDCNRLCSNYDSEEQVVCAPSCNPNRCTCRPDYVYDSNTGKCVLPFDCTPVCPVNEIYVECPITICTPKTCDEAGFPLCCLYREEGEPCPGDPGCICIEGYLRDSNGVCIPSADCPSCGGDPNATLGCGIECSRMCSNYNSEETVPVLLPCYPNACSCRADYVYDSNTEMCVLPFDCTPECGANAIYSKCANSVCRQTCEDVNRSDECLCPVCCEAGCVCEDGYLLDEYGNCVTIDECYDS